LPLASAVRFEAIFLADLQAAETREVNDSLVEGSVVVAS
jgi:hypothetical protein